MKVQSTTWQNGGMRRHLLMLRPGFEYLPEPHAS